MNIFLTSGGSYVGAALANYLSLQGHMVCFSYHNVLPELLSNRNIALKINFLEFSSDSLRQVCEFRPDAVINCTGLYYSARYSPSAMLSANICSSLFCNEIVKRSRAKKIIHLSSTSVYGAPLPDLQDAAQPNPTDDYGRAKLAQEELTMANSCSLAVNIRLPVVLGENAHRAWLPTVKKAMMNHEDIAYFNGDAFYTTFTSLQSLSRFVSKLIDSNDLRESFPIGGLATMSIRQILHYMATRLESNSVMVETSTSISASQILSTSARLHGYIPPSIEDALNHFL